MSTSKFDYNLADSQATAVKPLAPEKFDFTEYADYESGLLERCRKFWHADSGVAVYRRMRVAEVFSFGCKDMEKSLQWQLGALKMSMAYKADIPNFLEPWYGIGTVAGAFDIDYVWKENQAPAVRSKFKSVSEALSYKTTPVKDTTIGRHTLRMIDYFMDKTKARVAMSLTDVQSPLNIAGGIIDMNSFFMDMLDKPQDVKNLLKHLAELLLDFTKEQINRIGDSIVWPGHGFASCRCFEGFGASDDNALMLSPQQYLDFVVPAVALAAEPFGGPAFHSCGNWSSHIEAVKQIPNLRMVDAAFSAQTDPSPNPPELFAEAFANTGIIVNARIVGDCDTVIDCVKKLWTPGMKIIVVTYCQSPKEQEEVYNRIHEICG